MKDTIYLILAFLTIINALLVVAAAIAPATTSLNTLRSLFSLNEKKDDKKRAVTTIALSWLLKRQKTTLYIGFACLLLWVFSAGLAPESLKLVLCNILSAALIALRTRDLKTSLEKQCAQESIAVVRLELPENSFLEIWVKKSQEEWPPLYLEIGMGPWSKDAELMSQSLKEKMTEAMKGMFPAKADKLSQELKNCLNQAGATHPMDIRGSQAIPELSEFFEKCLLTKQ